MHYYTYGNDLSDCLQTGVMQLWERLVENPLPLTEYSSKRDAALIVKRLSKKTTRDKQNRKYLPFSVMEGDHEDLDMHETALTSTRRPSELVERRQALVSVCGGVEQHLDIVAAISSSLFDSLSSVLAGRKPSQIFLQSRSVEISARQINLKQRVFSG
jgi:hypothetical protein